MFYRSINLETIEENNASFVRKIEDNKIKVLAEKSDCNEEDVMYAVIYLCLYKIALSDEAHVCIEGIKVENRDIGAIIDIRRLIAYLMRLRKGKVSTDRHFEYGIFNFYRNNELYYSICDMKISFKIEKEILITYEGESISELEVDALNGIIKNIINELYSDHKKCISDIKPMSDEDEENCKQLYVKSERKYSEDKTIIDLFEEQVDKTPDSIAVSDMSTELTYSLFNKKINRVANFLIDKGIELEDVVAHLIPADVRCLIVLLGILKAGGVQLPMIHSMPNDRLNYMISDSRAKYVITTGEYEERFEDKDKLLFIEDILEYNKEENPHVHITLDNVYVCLYTSGTTGRPKGVMNTHRGMVYGVKYGIIPGVKSYGNSILSTPLSFIMANLEIYSPLVRGNKVLVVDPEIRKDINTFRNILCKNDAEILACTPSYFDAMTQNESDARRVCNSLKYILLGGEKVYVNSNVAKIYNESSVKILDAYGSTEVHLAALREITDEYGWAFHNVKFITVSKEGYMLPPGIRGEVYIAGDGVGAGYINDKKLSEEKFANGLFGFRRVYKTGDIGVLNKNGDLKILGRNDYQIKIRGYRIELKEVETVLDECAGVEKGIVIAKTNLNNEKYLCAFYTGTLDNEQVKVFLESKLPSYMIPSYITKMDELPKLISGKYDLKKLSEMEIEKTKMPYADPQTESQRRLVEIWSKVLCMEKVGIDDNFFEIGGDSIKAAKLIATVRNEMQSELSLKQFYEMPTIRKLAGVLGFHDSKDIMWEKAKEKDYYPMTSSQIGIYLSYQKNNKKMDYNLSYCLELDGKIDIGKLKNAFVQVTLRHEALRTSFHIVDGEFVQKIHESVLVDFNTVEVEEFDKSMIDKFICPFQLEMLPLMRVTVIEDRIHTVILLDVHHIIADGYSMQMMMQEICDLYNEKELPAPVYQFRDYSERLKKDEFRKKVDISKQYWINMMNHAEALKLNFLPDFQSTGNTEKQAKKYSNRISGALYKEIRTFCNQHGMTEHMLLLGCLSILFSRYANQKEFAIGTPILGRDDVESQKIMGMFVRTLPIVVCVEEGLTVHEYLGDIKKRCIQAFDNQNCPLEEIKSEVKHGEYNSIDSLFNVLFVLQNNKKASVSFGEHKILSVSTPDERDAMYEMLIEMDESDDGIDVCWQYMADLYHESTIASMFRHLKHIIVAVMNSMGVELADLDICTDDDRLEIEKFNHTDYKYDRNKTVVDLFNEQADANKDTIALEASDGKFSYGELNEKSNRIANALIGMGVQKNRIVPFMLSRNSNMIAALLGILKAGCAYMPIDTSYPESRIGYMIEDSGAEFVITDKKNSAKAEKCKTAVLVEDMIKYDNCSSPDIDININDLCYCIYTSGSTGTPKGTLLEHRTICNLITWEKETQEINLSGRVLAGTTISFDVASQEIMSSLLCGGTLVLLKDGEKTNINAYCSRVCDEQVDVLFCTPSYLDLIAEQGNWIEKVCEQVSDIVLAGEAIYINKHIKNIAEENCVRIHNHYGPTESHVVTAKTYHGDYCSGDISIGKPISNTKIYITDKKGKMLPAGVPGELCITGDNVGRGYWNREQLTSEKFILNSFGDGKMYMTGDIARWTMDGELQYLGRKDEQLKIRGLRIEPGEIRNVICKQLGVKDAIVIASENGGTDKILCAYITGIGELDLEEIRKAIRLELAEYMVPELMMQIDSIPINTNGKLDRDALPIIDLCDKESYVEPVGATEKMVCKYFSEVLGLDKVGAKDNFFRMGGHSLKAMQVANRIEQESGIRIDLKVFFANPSARELAEKLDYENRNNFKRIPAADKADAYPMSSAQKRMYILNQMDKRSLTYNLPFFLKVEGRLDIYRLQNAVNQTVKKHNILRTTFHMEDGEPVQKIHNEMQVNLEIGKEPKQFIRPFNLEAGPLLRICYVQKEENDSLMFDMHHIIADGITLKNLISEIVGAYTGLRLEDTVMQYCDYSEWLRKFRTADIEMQKQYWLDKFSNGVPVLDIITDFPRPSYQSYKGKTVIGEVPPKLSRKIKSFASKNDATPYMVLLSGVMILMNRYARQEEIVIGTPISGRVHKDTENMLGMFVNTLALRGKIENEKKYYELLQEIKKECLESFEHQEYPFEELVDNLSIRRDTSRNPLFDVVFNLQEEKPVKFDMGDAVISEEDMSHLYNISKFDMTVNVRDRGDYYCIAWEYCSDLFQDITIRRMMKIYIGILNQIVEKDDIRVADISICNEENRRLILNSFNKNKDVPLPFRNIGEAFDKSVSANHNKMAICFKNHILSYGELGERVNFHAGKLLENGLKSGDRVVVCMERGISIVVMQLAVIKAGGIFVPVDNDYPEHRILYTIRDSEAKFIVFDRASVLNVANGNKVMIYEDTDKSYITALNDYSITVPDKEPEDECYVIYTSGSTGEPKGCRLTHRGILNFCLNNNVLETVNNIKNPTGAAVNSVAFDYFIAESLFMLLNGFTVVLADRQEQIEQKAFKELVVNNGVNMIQTTPTRLGLFMEDKSDVDYFMQFEMIVLSGEELKKSLFREIKEITAAKLYNPCGPSEASVWAAGGDISDCENDFNRDIHIGKPICNVQLYILDKNNQLLPVGVPGELVIGGMGVGLGYINKDGLTEEKFIDNPYGAGKLYKTGDLVSWREDGNIKYLGRIDQQVKIRGLRIETGEIETVLKRQADIKNAVVISREINGEKQLCAYLVSDTIIDVSLIRRELEKILPQYMIPVHMMQIDKIYYNANGKLDKNQFPDIVIPKTEETKAPSGKKEMHLLQIMEQIIGMENISMEDDFFELGGDSIKAIRIVTKFREAGYEITVREILSKHTIGDVIWAAKEKNVVVPDSMEQITGNIPLTPIIREYMDWDMKYPEYFNQANMIKVKNTQYSEETLIDTMNILCEQHDMLRSVFCNRSLTVLPYEKNKNFNISYYDICNLQENNKRQYVNSICTKIHKSMNLKEGPLVKLGVFKDLQYTHIMICVHHLVIDGVSWRILLDDFDYIYEKRAAGEKNEVRTKTASYRDWVEALESYGNSFDIESQIKYWNQIVENIEVIVPNQDAYFEESIIDTISVSLDRDRTAWLRMDTQKAYNTEMNEILLAGLVGAVSKVTDKNKISISMEGHGREELNIPMQIDRTVGWFTNIYPLTFDTFAGNISQTIIHTKETIRKVPKKGIGYGIIKYMRKELIEHECPTLCFNYLGDFDAERMNHNIFVSSEYTCGRSISEHNRLSNDISINCFISDGTLIVDFSYDKKLYKEEFIFELAKNYLDYLDDIIMHCSEVEGTVYSGSDFGDTNLDSDELDEILQLFE